MAAKTTEKQGKMDAGMKTAEAWALEKQVPSVYLAGVKSNSGWATGKMVTEVEFDAALKAFLAAPADGRKKK